MSKLDKILQDFDDDNYKFWADHTDMTLTLEQWNRGKAKLRKKADKAITALLRLEVAKACLNTAEQILEASRLNGYPIETSVEQYIAGLTAEVESNEN